MLQFDSWFLFLNLIEIFFGCLLSSNCFYFLDLNFLKLFFIFWLSIPLVFFKLIKLTLNLTHTLLSRLLLKSQLVYQTFEEKFCTFLQFLVTKLLNNYFSVRSSRALLLKEGNETLDIVGEIFHWFILLLVNLLLDLAEVL